MTVSKRLRFEILRRDNHTCRYCGAAAPDVKITVDHVIALALGGDDRPENLVAACADCNSGKTSTGADEHLVADVNQDALRWKRARAKAAEIALADHWARSDYIGAVDLEWSGWSYSTTGEAVERDADWRVTVGNLYSHGLPLVIALDMVEVAMRARARSTWRYYAGCCWNRLAEIHEIASTVVELEEDT